MDTGQLITSVDNRAGRNGKFLKIIIISKNPTFNNPVISKEPKSVTKIGIRKSNYLVISMIMIAAENVLVNAERKVAVPHNAYIPGWTLNPNDHNISPYSLPNIEPIINAGVIIPLGIARVVNINRIITLETKPNERWVLIFMGHII